MTPRSFFCACAFGNSRSAKFRSDGSDSQRIPESRHHVTGSSKAPNMNLCCRRGRTWSGAASGLPPSAPKCSTPTPYTPTLYFGKGLGDLPYTLSWITPIAITGQIGYAIPARNFTATFGRGSFVVLAKSCVTTDRICGMVPCYRRDDENVALAEATARPRCVLPPVMKRRTSSHVHPALSLGNVSA